MHWSGRELIYFTVLCVQNPNFETFKQASVSRAIYSQFCQSSLNLLHFQFQAESKQISRKSGSKFSFLKFAKKRDIESISNFQIVLCLKREIFYFIEF